MLKYPTSEFPAVNKNYFLFLIYQRLGLTSPARRLSLGQYQYVLHYAQPLNPWNWGFGPGGWLCVCLGCACMYVCPETGSPHSRFGTSPGFGGHRHGPVFGSLTRSVLTSQNVAGFRGLGEAAFSSCCAQKSGRPQRRAGWKPLPHLFPNQPGP